MRFHQEFLVILPNELERLIILCGKFFLLILRRVSVTVLQNSEKVQVMFSFYRNLDLLIMTLFSLFYVNYVAMPEGLSLFMFPFVFMISYNIRFVFGFRPLDVRV
ncbi:hypothetical protein NE237_028150 [Protea cynaroides]|uniref:Uncharacterized protein n=1 Tax=Protea cynaroides TaxID=273540 RepID=A0A9Q0JV16_9MAGN|nr:hypothetical protein NE237_028150 [Protea cynaroides]